MDINSPRELHEEILKIASTIGASKQPDRKLVIAALNEVIAAVKKGKKAPKKNSKTPPEEVACNKFDSQVASHAHMSMLEQYKPFHDAGNELLGYQQLVKDGVPPNAPNEVNSAVRSCDQAFKALENAIRDTRSCYSQFMAILAKY